MKRGLCFSAALLAGCLCFAGGAPGSVSAGPDPDNLIVIQERAQETLNRKAEKYHEEARRKAAQSQGILEQLNDLRREAAEAQSRVERLEAEGRRLQEQSAAISRDIAATAGELARLGGLMRARAVSIYKYGQREGMFFIFSARDSHEILTTSYLLSRLVRQDQGLFQELEKESAGLARSRAALEESRAQVQRQTAELRQQRAGLDASIRKTNALLKDIRRQQKKAETAAGELAQAQQELGNRILALRKQREMKPSPPPEQAPAPSRQPEPAEKTPPAARQPEPAEKTPPAARQPQHYTWLPRGAALEWPVRGAVAIPFGSRVHPVFRTKIFNSGIDIKAASGTPVRAAGPGEVLFQGWLRGFGQVIIIDHGGDISTVYAHLAATSVQVGDAVQAGSIIGTAGSSGTNTEPGLHFEVRRGGSAQNPLNYLRKS
ncbi:MAG: peptidoglycan DD-metalloendopeptidase family protein [Fretibacterium sp.]|nr:peptidoglycan DD-metalloendopeptidase family protein [Fretibacterium sp.]